MSVYLYVYAYVYVYVYVYVCGSPASHNTCTCLFERCFGPHYYSRWAYTIRGYRRTLTPACPDTFQSLSCIQMMCEVVVGLSAILLLHLCEIRARVFSVGIPHPSDRVKFGERATQYLGHDFIVRLVRYWLWSTSKSLRRLHTQTSKFWPRRYGLLIRLRPRATTYEPFRSTQTRHTANNDYRIQAGRRYHEQTRSRQNSYGRRR